MKVRKIVAGLAAVSMLAAFSAQAVFAADGVVIKAGEAKAEAGKDFTLEISLENVPAAGTNAVEFAVTYDAKVLSISSVTAGKVAQTGVNDAEKLEGVNGFEAGWDTAGTITITYSTGLTDAAYAMGDGVFAVISGKVAEGTADGEYPVQITAIPRESVQGKGDVNKEVKSGLMKADGTIEKYATSGADGKVIVGTAAVETDPPTETDKPTDQPTEEQKPGNVKYCDVNCDGTIDIMDVIKINKYLIGSAELNDEATANADVDVSGDVNSTDALNILKRVVGAYTDANFPIKK